jgi:uncharacterized cupredoxin-like copper-binding protein
MITRVRRFSILMVLVLAAGLIASACSGSSTSSGGTVDVNITASDFKIESSLTNFKQGVTYHFIVKNTGSVDHEVYILPPASGLSVDQAKQQALAGVGPDVLTAGATATFDYTFTQAYPAGSLELSCHISGHYEAGMLLPIVVE